MTMTEEEKQALMQKVIDSVQDYFDNYDWDKKFIEHFGEQKLISYLKTTRTTSSAVAFSPSPTFIFGGIPSILAYEYTTGMLKTR